MKLLASFVLSAALAPAALAAAPSDPELYSFADVYRLAVGEEAPPAEAFAAAPVRVSIAPAGPAAPRFSVRRPGPVQQWLLFLSGLAAAGWVAHRRLVNPL